MAKTEYQRLTRASARGSFAVAVMTRTSLWLGSDHVLFVETNGYTETYKRFYFRDIQALTVQKMSLVNAANIVLAILSFVLLVLAIAMQDTAARVAFGVLAGIFTFILLLSLLQGRTCRCFLRTAVQIEELPSLSRLRRAEKVFARIRPLIAAAQGGELSPQMVAEQMQEPFQGAAATPAGVDNPNIPPRLESFTAP